MPLKPNVVHHLYGAVRSRHIPVGVAHIGGSNRRGKSIAFIKKKLGSWSKELALLEAEETFKPEEHFPKIAELKQRIGAFQLALDMKTKKPSKK